MIQFRKDLLREGRPGGIQAAQNLRQAVEEAIQDLSLRVKVRVYLNSGGLAKYYRRIGSIYDEETLTEFNRGFTNVQPLFDVVDCGVGKEVADSKIRGTEPILQDRSEPCLTSHYRKLRHRDKKPRLPARNPRRLSRQRLCSNDWTVRRRNGGFEQDSSAKGTIGGQGVFEP